MYTVTVTVAPAAKEKDFGASPSIADTASIDVVGVEDSVNFVYASDGTFTIPTGTDDSDSEVIATKFWMAKTETTNELAAAILQWAKDNGKLNTSDSEAHNFLNATKVKYGKQELLDLDDEDCKITYSNGTFSAESGYEQHPVVEVSWYGAVMLCNWLTEMRDGDTSNVVYTGMPTDGNTWNDDNTSENLTKTGYRLPGKYEWECAARYRGDDNTNTVTGYSNPCWTKGDSASGATANDATARGEVAWYDSNSGGELHEVAQKTANALGIYDMSGSVWEWCFTDSSIDRVVRGGSWDNTASYIQVGNYGAASPFNGYGFRLFRTQPQP